MIHCPECTKVMQLQESMGVYGGFSEEVFTCNTCRVRCVVETRFYYDADRAVEIEGEQHGSAGAKP